MKVFLIRLDWRSFISPPLVYTEMILVLYSLIFFLINFLGGSCYFLKRILSPPSDQENGMIFWSHREKLKDEVQLLNLSLLFSVLSVTEDEATTDNSLRIQGLHCRQRFEWFFNRLMIPLKWEGEAMFAVQEVSGVCLSRVIFYPSFSIESLAWYDRRMLMMQLICNPKIIQGLYLDNSCHHV